MRMSRSVRFVVCFFFFKQKTAYEMRISDWSSDVCSSDLTRPSSSKTCRESRRSQRDSPIRSRSIVRRARDSFTLVSPEFVRFLCYLLRSEERRVGKSVSVRVDLGGRRIIKKKINNCLYQLHPFEFYSYL